MKALTPRSLKSRLRSVVVYSDKHMQEMGGASSLSAELGAVEEYREAVDEMVNLRDLLNRILKQIELVGQTATNSRGSDQ